MMRRKRKYRAEGMEDLFGYVAADQQKPPRRHAHPPRQPCSRLMPPPPAAPVPLSVEEIDLANRRAAMAALVKEREIKHMTLLDISWDSGVSWDAVRSWAQGRREPTMGNLIAVAQTLGFEIILRKKQPEN